MAIFILYAYVQYTHPDDTVGIFSGSLFFLETFWSFDLNWRLMFSKILRVIDDFSGSGMVSFLVRRRYIRKGLNWRV